MEYVSLKVYDVLGNEGAVLVNGVKEAGNDEVNFDAASLSSGIYFYSINAEYFYQVRK
ncbi:MAG: T9SS type A sorting domain-containing protein [Melioribacteraceae bacterium]|nr:T9SS type A sorting domain-containing protein [Melioribacteraceae bacterium]MCF8263372.1 T9SS type A sorting domain-containing protein [Melioribacteraceae bacterium]MCF8430858.1 T9SS type A sorting domain-containing protein [Melioribacteraceae bacterium]